MFWQRQETKTMSPHQSPHSNFPRQQDRFNNSPFRQRVAASNGNGTATGSAQGSPYLQGARDSGTKIKCVFLGDGAVGKTSLIVSYTTNGYPSEYVPTAIDTYDVVVHVDDSPVTFEMCDTPGQDDFDTLRPLVYPETDVFLLCFSVVSPSSFHNVREKWIPELRGAFKSSKQVPVILVGTQSDLRTDVKTLVELAKHKEQPVSEAEARKMSSSLGCEMYIESSAVTQKNLKEVFDEAIVCGLRQRRIKDKKAANKLKKSAAGGNGCFGGQCVIV